MSARDSLANGQFPMFIQAGDLQHSVAKVDGSERQGVHVPDAPVGQQYRDETDSELWSRKLNESAQPEAAGGHGSGVLDSVREKGVHTPVELYASPGNSEFTGTVANGYHRITSANNVDPNSEVPVSWRHA